MVVVVLGAVVLVVIVVVVVVVVVMVHLVPRGLAEVDTLPHSHLQEVAMAMEDPHQEGQESQIM